VRLNPIAFNTDKGRPEAFHGVGPADLAVNGFAWTDLHGTAIRWTSEFATVGLLYSRRLHAGSVVSTATASSETRVQRAACRIQRVRM